MTTPLGDLSSFIGRKEIHRVDMDLISLELNRTGAGGEESTAPVPFTDQLRTLILGIALHSIETRPEEFATLQRQMSDIAAQIHTDSSPEDMLAAIGTTLRTLEVYNQMAAGVFKAQVEELRAMVAAMTETLQFVLSSSDASVKQLSFVESNLKRADGLDDLRQLKTYTAACLNLVRRESSRLQAETNEKLKALKADVERLSLRLKTAAVEESEDPVTGLPGRAAAEQAMEDRISTGKPCVAALFLMERLATINSRFGHDVGNDIVMGCAQMLAKKLHSATLYRWSGPGFVAMFDPLVPCAEAENRARQAAAQKLEKNIEADGRMLMVVVGVSCQVQQLSKQTAPGELFQRLDSFMAAAQG